ncbi:MAG TPA: hypothetical protein HA306_01090 [Methanosarcina sp.]|nr:hypothetical protein [Methanosarcina sp.]
MAWADLWRSLFPKNYMSSIFLFIVSYIFLPHFGITDPIKVFIISIIICLVVGFIIQALYYIAKHLLFPVVKAEFNNSMNQLILDRQYPGSRAEDISISVKLEYSKQFSTLCTLLHLNLKHFFICFYWEPREVFNFKPNSEYPTLLKKDNTFPSICLGDLVPNNLYTYSLRISCTSHYQEVNETVIRVKSFTNPGTLKYDLILRLFRIDAGEKKVVIKKGN